MLSNLKIGVRSIAGFLLVDSISALVGFIGITNMAKVNNMADDMYNKGLMMGLSPIKEANIGLIYIGRACSNFLLAASLAEREKHLASIAKSSASPPAFGARIRTDFIQGMGKVRGKFVTLLDVDHVPSLDEHVQADLALAALEGRRH